MTTISLNAWPERSRRLLPGALACGVVAAAATWVAEHHGAPVMLIALLLGIAMNFMSTEVRCSPGIEFCSKTMLRAGIALLGMRITLPQILSLGWPLVAFISLSVILIIALSMLAARALRFDPLFGLLTGGATAICGASAALALSSAMPPHPQKERATMLTVIAVSTLSTLAMVAYPTIARWMALDPHKAGIFLGGTIHDVAQVVGAGYSMSQETGDTATLVKLLRVAMLLPIVTLTAAMTRATAAAGSRRPPLVPWFVAGFAVLVCINSVGCFSASTQQLGSDVSRWLLVVAVASIGMKTRPKELLNVGIRPIALILCETILLAALVLTFLHAAG